MLPDSKQKPALEPRGDLEELGCTRWREGSRQGEAASCVSPSTAHPGKGSTVGTARRSASARVRSRWGMRGFRAAKLLAVILSG